ncbi:MAG: DUF721 domain-containing protein [Actinobacteria bacterium]|nr:DUF721 domain-containing protein [Actinomycetota bacterium]
MDRQEPDDVVRLGELLGQTYDVLAGEGVALTGSRGKGHGRGAAAARPKGAPSTSPEQTVAVLWPEIVGAEVAANTRPVQLRKKRLVVSASSSAWAQTLHFMGPSIVARVNECIGAGTVGEIVFHHAGWEERSRHHSPSPDPSTAPVAAGEAGRERATSDDPDAGLTAEQRASLAEVEQLDLEPGLRDRMLRAMRAAFVRGQQDRVR